MTFPKPLGYNCFLKAFSRHGNNNFKILGLFQVFHDRTSQVFYWCCYDNGVNHFSDTECLLLLLLLDVFILSILTESSRILFAFSVFNL